MKQLLIFCIFILLSVVLISCKNEKKGIVGNRTQNIDTLYQLIWEEAIEERDFATMDTLIQQNRRFSIPVDVYSWYVSGTDWTGSPLECLLYQSMYFNWNLSSQIFQTGLEHKRNKTYINLFLQNDDSLSKDDIYDIEENEQFIQRRENEEYRQSKLDSLSIINKEINEQLIQLIDSCNSNMKIIEYVLNKGYLINQKVFYNIIYTPSEGSEIIQQSTRYFYDKLYKHPEYFIEEVDFEQFSPTQLLIEYITYLFAMDPDFLRFLLSKKINEKEFFERVYPDTNETEEELGPDSRVPCYEAEKVLFEYMPAEMEKHSGHNLLHAAIVNADLLAVKALLSKNKSLLSAMTNPIHPYLYYEYGKKTLTPLELATYKLNQWNKEFKEYSDFKSQFKINQIKKIIELLQIESEPNKQTWSTLID